MISPASRQAHHPINCLMLSASALYTVAPFRARSHLLFCGLNCSRLVQGPRAHSDGLGSAEVNHGLEVKTEVMCREATGFLSSLSSGRNLFHASSNTDQVAVNEVHLQGFCTIPAIPSKRARTSLDQASWLHAGEAVTETVGYLQHSRISVEGMEMEWNFSRSTTAGGLLRQATTWSWWGIRVSSLHTREDAGHKVGISCTDRANR
jgi:hypothetical protein